MVRPKIVPLALKLTAVVIAAVTACFGCTANLQNKFEHPPLVQRIDARVGVFFPGAVRDYVYVMKGYASHTVGRFPLGQASVGRFRQVFQAMFAQTTDLADWPPLPQGSPDVDGVIELDQIAMYAVLGDIVSVDYRVCLYQADAVLIVCTPTHSSDTHAHQDLSCFPSLLHKCLAPQTTAAMRGAIARFIVDFEADPQVRAWAMRVADSKRTN